MGFSPERAHEYKCARQVKVKATKTKTTWANRVVVPNDPSLLPVVVPMSNKLSASASFYALRKDVTLDGTPMEARRIRADLVFLFEEYTSPMPKLVAKQRTAWNQAVR